MHPVAYIVPVVLMVALCSSGFGVYYYRGVYKSAKALAEQYKIEKDAAIEARDKMEIALSEQEKVALQAQTKQKVVYKTIKQEVEKNETSRDWFNSAVPDGMRRLLKDISTAK